jgi:hypothetical protein
MRWTVKQGVFSSLISKTYYATFNVALSGVNVGSNDQKKLIPMSLAVTKQFEMQYAKSVIEESREFFGLIELHRDCSCSRRRSEDPASLSQPCKCPLSEGPRSFGDIALNPTPYRCYLPSPGRWSQVAVSSSTASARSSSN